MKLLPRTLDGRLRLAAVLVFMGLLVTLATLFWTHALSFMLFIGIGGGLVGLGMLIYLVALVRFTRPR